MINKNNRNNDYRLNEYEKKMVFLTFPYIKEWLKSH